VHGGRKNALAILENISDFKDYDKKRDYPSEKTTNLSGHHKFGTISIRESYHAVKKSLGKEHTLIREIYWRDFFTHIAYFFHMFLEKSSKKNIKK
jgi:deoxyribodipyrimidine photo-lyase